MVRKQTQQTGNGKERGQSAQKTGTDPLPIDFTRDEGQLIYSVFAAEKLLLGRPNWKCGETICDKLEKAFGGQ